MKPVNIDKLTTLLQKLDPKAKVLLWGNTIKVELDILKFDIAIPDLLKEYDVYLKSKGTLEIENFIVMDITLYLTTQDINNLTNDNI